MFILWLKQTTTHLFAKAADTYKGVDGAVLLSSMTDNNHAGNVQVALHVSHNMLCRERANLAVQLKDTKSVVGRLKSVISVVLHILFIFFYLVIYNVSCPHFLHCVPQTKALTLTVPLLPFATRQI